MFRSIRNPLLNRTSITVRSLVSIKLIQNLFQVVAGVFNKLRSRILVLFYGMSIHNFKKLLHEICLRYILCTSHSNDMPNFYGTYFWENIKLKKKFIHAFRITRIWHVSNVPSIWKMFNFLSRKVIFKDIWSF
jgi:hypothetical protein